jgi:hypothetical protein
VSNPLSSRGGDLDIDIQRWLLVHLLPRRLRVILSRRKRAVFWISALAPLAFVILNAIFRWVR